MIVYDKNTLTSNRSIDDNGYLRADECNISKSQVRPYLGKEIPNWREFGLEPDKIYNVYCPAEELEKAAKTFNNLPLTREHIEVNVDNVPKEKIVGSLGDHASFEYPYLKNNLIIYDKKDIDLVMSGKKKELSCGYRYTPVQQAGEVDGQHYDFVMTDIIGNHVALVKQGRAGRDVMVADSSKGILETIKEKIMAVFDKDLVGDEFKESEHPRAKNGQFTTAGGSGSSSSKMEFSEHKNAAGEKSMRASFEHSGAKVDAVKEGKYVSMKIYAPEGKKFKNGDTFYTTETEADKAEELAKKIIDNEFGSSEKKDVFKSRFSKHTVRRDDPNYKAELSAAKNDLKEAVSAFEKNVENQQEKFKWIEQQRLDMAKADLEDLEKFEKESSEKKEYTDEEISQKHSEYTKKAIELLREGRELKEGSEEYKEVQKKLKDLQKEYDDVLTAREKKAAKQGVVIHMNGKTEPVGDISKEDKVGIVMKEFKEGELKSGSGEKVTDPKQAIAIALSEADKVAKDKEIPEKQDEPEKAGDDKALEKGEEEMTEEVKKALAEEKVEEAKKEEVVEDACGKAKDKDVKACDKSVDKRALIDEIGGILKDKLSEEEWRTVIKKAEELAYNDSEASADDEKKEDLKGKEKEAFAEGVDFGEKKEKEEPKKLDSEHESEGEKKAEEKKEMAKDEAMVMDADAIRAEAREEVIADFKARETARRAVRKMVGDVDVFAFDSAEDIYKFACGKAGMNLDEIASYKDAFCGLTAAKGKLALDASPISGSNVECLKDIRVAY